jgi:hypothetical protein
VADVPFAPEAIQEGHSAREKDSDALRSRRSRLPFKSGAPIKEVVDLFVERYDVRSKQSLNDSKQNFAKPSCPKACGIELLGD